MTRAQIERLIVSDIERQLQIPVILEWWSIYALDGLTRVIKVVYTTPGVEGLQRLTAKTGLPATVMRGL